jgi:hypothetical protein
MICEKKQSGFKAAHCLAETHSVLTGMPGKDRASRDNLHLELKRFGRLGVDVAARVKTPESLFPNPLSESPSPISRPSRREPPKAVIERDYSSSVALNGR